MSVPAVSVLMPARNASAFICDAMESMLTQTWRDFELLVIDDASEDDTVDRILSFRDARIRLLRSKERKRLAGALNWGLQEARGEWIARMDADDVAHPRRLERQILFLSRHPEIEVCGTDVNAFGAGQARQRLRYPRRPEQVRAFSLFHCPFAHPTVMFRRRSFINHQWKYNVDYYPAEDYELWARVLGTVQGANLPCALLRYRRHQASMTGAEWTDMDRQAARIQARMLAELGLPADPASAERHRAWAMGRIDPSIHALQEAERWLIRIRDANRNVRRYDESALDEVLEDRWFTLAMACARIGREAVACYQTSPLAGEGLRKMCRISILAASILKRAALGRL